VRCVRDELGRLAMIGTKLSETFVGTSGPDRISPLDGNDVVKALAGDDLVCGGSGRDTLNGGKGTGLGRNTGSRAVPGRPAAGQLGPRQRLRRQRRRPAG
jgi:RTX calcium-binding nonapeptide repeat (4 copies)